MKQTIGTNIKKKKILQGVNIFKLLHITEYHKNKLSRIMEKLLKEAKAPSFSRGSFYSKIKFPEK